MAFYGVNALIRCNEFGIINYLEVSEQLAV